MAKESRNDDDGGTLIEGGTPIEPVEPVSTHYLEIVWSSPVFTEQASSPGKADEELQPEPAPARKYVHAFESDFLDATAFSWDLSDDEGEAPQDHGQLIAQALSRTSSSDVRLIDIYPAAAAVPAQTDLGGAAKPTPEVATVRIDFASQPLPSSNDTPLPGADWRPQGMVFFETVSLRPRPPRRVVYSSSEEVTVVAPLPAPPVEVLAAVDGEPEPSPEALAVKEATKPFFEIPDHLPPTVAEDTAEILRVQPKPRGLLSRLLNLASWFVLVLFFITVAVSLLYVRYARHRLYEAQPGSSRMVDLIVQPGDTFRNVADKLNREGMFGSYLGISDWYLFRYLAHVNENSNQLKPGAYRLNASLGLNEVYTRLIQGSQDYKITIPEGKTAQEVASEVGRRYETFDPARFMDLVNDPMFIGRLGLDVPSLEGYLYPSTYFYGPGMKEEDLIKLMVATFKQSVESKLKDLPKQDNLSFHEHVIMASLIEKEARMDEDRPLIASVIHNRLNQNMLLQIDATVNFALQDWRRLNYQDLKVDSPYNTYLNKGLPPGPICSPRAASIMATFTAPQTDYIYYVYKGDGRHAFSASYEEFLVNKRQYIKSQVAPVPEGPAPLADEPTSKTVAGTAVAPAKRGRK